MTELLNSIRVDLLDRRRLPLLVLLAAALAGAVAYAVLSSGSTGGTQIAAVAPVAPGATGLTVSQAPATNPTQPVAETTDGASHQHHGIARNPFAPIVSPAKVLAPTSGAGKTPAAPSTAATGSGSAGGASPVKTTPAPSKPATPKQPTEPTLVYHVSVLFGVAPAPPAQSTPLTPYDNLKRLTPLPSAEHPLVVFRGVTAGGKSATFTVVGETILHGDGTCLPSASQCQAIDLKPGQTEQLEYLPPSGPAIVYQLQAVGITSSTASPGTATHAFRDGSRSGRELLRRAGLMALPGLRYSMRKGVLVFAAHRAVGARARSARRR
jgi:hypothetical protein